MLSYKTVRSRRKTCVIQVLRDGSIEVRAPFWYSDHQICRFVLSNEDKLKRMIEKQMVLPKPNVIDETERKLLKKKARPLLLDRLAIWSKKTGLSYTEGKITSAEKRFGSCSGRNTICLSCYLCLLEDELVDYVILHELCHTVHHNHSKAFYALIERYMPDWKSRHDSLKKIVLPTVEKRNKG